jgi:hypothetical protein
MARIFNGTSDLMSAAVNLSAFNKATVSFWLWWDAYANDYDLALEYTTDAGGTNGGFAFIPNDASGGLWSIYVRGTVSFTQVDMARPSAAGWHHFMVNLDPSTAGAGAIPAAYVDGVSQSLGGGSANSVSGSFANSTLYFMSRGGSALFGAGRIAEVGIYGGVLLTADEAGALAKGFSPEMIRPSSLEHYWPIIGRTSPEIELIGGGNAMVTGAAVTEHPRMIYPAGPYAIEAPAIAPSGPEDLFHSGIFDSSVFRRAA